METWNHLRAILLLPCMAAVVIPATILLLTGLDTFDLWQSVPATGFVLPVVGGLFLALGLVLMVATIRLFTMVGKGTLAPWNPTQKLVVQGVYRHVRNPMISGVMFILLGEAVLAASLPLLIWFGVFVLVNVVYIPLMEEPGLLKRFGDDYLAYKQNVARWMPRMRPAGEAAKDLPNASVVADLLNAYADETAPARQGKVIEDHFWRENRARQALADAAHGGEYHRPYSCSWASDAALQGGMGHWRRGRQDGQGLAIH